MDAGGLSYIFYILKSVCEYTTLSSICRHVPMLAGPGQQRFASKADALVFLEMDSGLK